jgi:hypothetical protein
LKLKKYK